MTSGDKYFLRALLLVKAEWKVFAAGLLCLSIYNGISLAMPTVQGSILNAVVSQNHGRFIYWIKWYLIAAIFLGLFGGVQSLCFNIAGTRCVYYIYVCANILYIK